MPEFTHTHRRILTLLPEGDSEPISSTEIAAKLNYNPSHATAPAVRKKIRDLIALGVPIASGQSGYFIVRTKGELSSEKDSLWGRAHKILDRLSDLKDAWESSSDWREEILEEEEIDPQRKLFGDGEAS